MEQMGELVQPFRAWREEHALRRRAAALRQPTPRETQLEVEGPVAQLRPARGCELQPLTLVLVLGRTVRGADAGQETRTPTAQPSGQQRRQPVWRPARSRLPRSSPAVSACHCLRSLDHTRASQPEAVCAQGGSLGSCLQETPSHTLWQSSRPGAWSTGPNARQGASHSLASCSCSWRRPTHACCLSRRAPAAGLCVFCEAAFYSSHPQQARLQVQPQPAQTPGRVLRTAQKEAHCDREEQDKGPAAVTPFPVLAQAVLLMLPA